MAEGGNFLTKKLGPQPRWLWGAEALAGFLLYRFIRHRQSGGLTSVTATPLTGGNTIPLGQSSGTTGTAGFSTLSAWITAALAEVATTPGYSSTAALNDLTSWLNGSCVSSQGYNAIGAAIMSIGLPPGFSTPPTLSVCPSTNTSNNNGSNPAPPAPPAPAATKPQPISATAPALGTLTSQVIGNVVSVFRQGTGWVYVTDQGYVYNSPGSNYYGGTDAGAVGGPIASHIVDAFAIKSGPNAGGYTLVASNGDTYNFGPAANYSPL